MEAVGLDVPPDAVGLDVAPDALDGLRSCAGCTGHTDSEVVPDALDGLDVPRMLLMELEGRAGCT
jgi:hypothetical protein